MGLAPDTLIIQETLKYRSKVQVLHTKTNVPSQTLKKSQFKVYRLYLDEFSQLHFSIGFKEAYLILNTVGME